MDKINTSSCIQNNMPIIPNFQEIEKHIENNVMIIVKSMIKTFKFNWIYSQNVSEEQEKITAKSVKEYREEFWNKALKQAKGDEEKAYEIYMNLYPI